MNPSLPQYLVWPVNFATEPPEFRLLILLCRRRRNITSRTRKKFSFCRIIAGPNPYTAEAIGMVKMTRTTTLSLRMALVSPEGSGANLIIMENRRHDPTLLREARFLAQIFEGRQAEPISPSFL